MVSRMLATVNAVNLPARMTANDLQMLSTTDKHLILYKHVIANLQSEIKTVQRRFQCPSLMPAVNIQYNYPTI